jgi:hypothetical protein
MTKLSAALAAFALTAPALAAAQDIAPPVKRKPVPAATSRSPQSPVRPVGPQEYRAALTAVSAQGDGDPTLDSSLIGVMSNLLAAGRCAEAASLATRDGRKALASRAQQLCK